MITDCKHLMKLQPTDVEQTHSKCVKVSFKGKVKYKLLILMIMRMKTNIAQFKGAAYS